MDRRHPQNQFQHRVTSNKLVAPFNIWDPIHPIVINSERERESSSGTQVPLEIGARTIAPQILSHQQSNHEIMTNRSARKKRLWRERENLEFHNYQPTRHPSESVPSYPSSHSRKSTRRAQGGGTENSNVREARYPGRSVRQRRSRYITDPPATGEKILIYRPSVPAKSGKVSRFRDRT